VRLIRLSAAFIDKLFYSFLTFPAFTVLAALIGSTQAHAESALPVDSEPTRYALWIIIGILLAVESVLILGLQRSRLNHKRTRNALRESQRELEQRIHERTSTLEETNRRLNTEIASHETTVGLLRSTKAYLQSLLNAMPSVIIGVNQQGLVTHWNAEAETVTGTATRDALGQPLEVVYPSPLLNQALIQQTVNAGVPYRKENAKEGSGSEARYTDLTIYPLITDEHFGAVIRLDDVTASVTIEHMIIQSEKMLSLGELAAGIAHEINNPLGAILQHVQNISRRLSPDLERNRQTAAELGLDLQLLQTYLQRRDIDKFLRDIKAAGERSASIVTNMLEFSHTSNQPPGPVDLATVIDKAIELGISLGNTRKNRQRSPQIIKDISPTLPRIFGNSAELEQVLLNLINNARQALTEDDNYRLDPPIIRVSARQSGQEVHIDVQDNGPGMSEEVKKHIFEPFYTTKEVGKGTGLGLSVSYFIIAEHHKGAIIVESTPGAGATFSIRLPIPAASTVAHSNL